MAVFVSDGFGGTSGDALSTYSASWSKHPSKSATAYISSAGRVRASGSGQNPHYIHSATPGAAEYEIQVDVYRATNSLTGDVALSGRTDPSATTYYLARFVRDSDTCDLYKAVAGAFSLLVSGVSVTPPASGGSKALKLRCYDATKKIYWDGSEIGSSSDNAITATGKAGFWLDSGTDVADNTTGLHLDNFTATDTTGGGTTYTVSLAGTLTTAGALAKQPRLLRAGALTTGGAHAKQVGKPFAGTLTTAGTIAALKTRLLALGGALTPAGALVKRASLARDGTLATAGALARRIDRAFGGALTTSGALANGRFVALAGALTAAGDLATTLIEVALVVAARWRPVTGGGPRWAARGRRG